MLVTEITAQSIDEALKKQLEQLNVSVESREVGTVIQVGDGMRDMNDSIVYTEPDDYFDEYGDSSAASMPANGELYTAPDHESEVDEFEVVTGPE